MVKCAVIDLGTNTFHLLVATRDAAGQWHNLVRQKVYVKLAENGIQRIDPAAFSRAWEALKGFKTMLASAGVPPDHVRAFGTAALRTAENAGDFIEKAGRELGIGIEVISGDREAALIYRGVRQAVPLPADRRVLIMDIGGGSVEFVLADATQVFWQQSFPIGVAVLFHRFHRHDPITVAEIRAEEDFLETTLTPLWQVLDRLPATALVGASGTFDVLDNFLLDSATRHPLHGRVTTRDFAPLCELFLRSTLAERRQMPQLAPERVEMIVVAMILIRLVLRRAGLTEIITSAYAMKEGMLEELAEGFDN